MKISRVLLLSLSLTAVSPLAIYANDIPVADEVTGNALMKTVTKFWDYTGKFIWDKTGSVAEALQVKALIEKVGGLSFLKDRSVGTWLVENSDKASRITLLATAALVTYFAYNKYVCSQKKAHDRFDIYFNDEDDDKKTN